jgi:exodeoxyribonuclease V gamma subunit
MLHVHRAERADRLADALGEILAKPPSDPFAPELVAVATRGMERWLAQTLAARLGAGAGSRDGVCANVEFPFPARLLGGALATATGIDPDADPWTAERMVWPLLATVDACAAEPWFEPVAAHLDSSPGRRFARVRLIAGLFDGYATRRPALLVDWAGGAGDGWQPQLWRALRDRIGLPSPAERLAGACARLRAEPQLLDLPARLSLFGLTRLPGAQLEIVHALAAGREVHLLLLHPSPALWDQIELALAGEAPAAARVDDRTARLPRNRLLASWGRESRELQLVLAAAGPGAAHHHELADEPPATLLAALQADIRADRAPAGAPLPGEPDRRLHLLPGDASVRVHACHGRQRQVEVLREAILHRLAADPTLEPRDVIVMCPDIETFAPLIEATFGTSHDDGGHELAATTTDLRVRLADRALRRTNPILGVVAQLLELASARLTASQVLDLADTDPVRRRFGFGDEDLARIQDWIVDCGIHWGLDAGHRSDVKLADVDAGTWAAGLRRLLLGVAIRESGQRLYGGVLPIDDVEGDAIELAGRFAELLDRLGAALDTLAGPHTIVGWTEAVARAADTLTAVPDQDAWQRYELARLLDEVVAEAAGSAASARLALPELRALLAARLEGRPTRANFRTGHLTVCTLHPMRSVPHRVVCLLGLDDGAFPRRSPRNGDDLLLAAPRVGDRDPRAEDRQLLLDALMAAREHLIVTFSGNDERTNQQRPPAVPVGELLDAVDATAVAPPGSDDPRARSLVLVRHPLQPFDPANFAAGRLTAGRPWSYDPVALDGALALTGDRARPAPFLTEPLPLLDEETLALADLVAFVERPVRAFLRQRLGVSAVSYDDEVDDRLPVELDGLELWGVGQRLLEGVMSGTAPRDCALAEIARGTLPPGTLGMPVIKDRVWPAVDPIVRHALASAGTGEAVSVEANLVLGDGTRLTGTVSGVRDRVLLAVSYSRLNARHRIAAWVRLLALTAAHPEVPYEAVTIGRSRDQDADVAIARVPPLGRGPDERRAAALTELAALAELRRRGLREPLPLPCLTAAAYATAIVRERLDPPGAAIRAGIEWTSEFDRNREDREDDHLLAFGGQLALAELLAFVPAAEEAGPGWAAAEPTRLGRLALRLWQPLLHREQLEEL